MKHLITIILISILIISMFGFFYRDYNPNKMFNHHMNDYWKLNNTNIDYNHNMMNNNLRINKRTNHNSMNNFHHGM